MNEMPLHEPLIAEEGKEKERVFTGTPEQLIRSASGHVGVFYEREANQEDGLHITARVNTAQGVRCRAVADQLPAFVQPEEPTLEDAYLYLISREAVQ